MNSVNNEIQQQYLSAYQNTTNQKTNELKSNEETASVDYDAVKVSISTQGISQYLNLNTSDYAKGNFLAQSGLTNLLNNQDISDFLSGKTNAEGFNLESIGYTGTPISELTKEEASDLVSDDGFFGVTQTSDRVSSFAFNLAGDDLEKLNEIREGLVKGFEEAESMFGGKLPDISYETQNRTLSIIDKKIEELSS